MFKDNFVEQCCAAYIGDELTLPERETHKPVSF